MRYLLYVISLVINALSCYFMMGLASSLTVVCTITAIYYIESKRAEDNRVFLAIQAFCMIFNIARLVISSIMKVNCGDSAIVLSIFVVGIVCVEKMIKVCDRE